MKLDGLLVGLMGTGTLAAMCAATDTISALLICPPSRETNNENYLTTSMTTTSPSTVPYHSMVAPSSAAPCAPSTAPAMAPSDVNS